MLRALVLGGLLACSVLFVGYVAASEGLDGPCGFHLNDPEGSSVSNDIALWPPGGAKCVTEYPDGRVRTETFPRDSYWFAALAFALAPLIFWARWLRGTSPADWSKPWQRHILAVAEVVLTLLAAGFAAFALLFFFILVWLVPPMGPICAALAGFSWRWAKDLRSTPPIDAADASAS